MVGKLMMGTGAAVLAVIGFKVLATLIGIVTGIFGAVFGLITFVLFTALPIALIGYLGYRAYHAFRKEPAA